MSSDPYFQIVLSLTKAKQKAKKNILCRIRMIYNPDKHHRRSIRLKGYDYSNAGVYFVTICIQNRECLLGEITNGEMKLNEYGKIVEYTWNDLINHNQHIQLDNYIVMPNHVHGIIIIYQDGANMVGAGSEPAPTKTKTKHHGLTEIIRQFKTFSALRINKIRQSSGVRVWQRNYYEHIVRDENALNRIRQYIIENPLKWDSDKDNPKYLKTD